MTRPLTINGVSVEVLARIRGYADDTVETQIPDINDSLGLVSNYKLSLERPSGMNHSTSAVVER